MKCLCVHVFISSLLLGGFITVYIQENCKTDLLFAINQGLHIVCAMTFFC